MFGDGSRCGAWNAGRDVLGVDVLVADEVDDFEEELFGLGWFVSGVGWGVWSGGFDVVRMEKGRVGEVGRREEGSGRCSGWLATSRVEQRKGGNEDIPCARSLESRTVVMIVSIHDKRKIG